MLSRVWKHPRKRAENGALVAAGGGSGLHPAASSSLSLPAFAIYLPSKSEMIPSRCALTAGSDIASLSRRCALGNVARSSPEVLGKAGARTEGRAPSEGPREARGEVESRPRGARRQEPPPLRPVAPSR